MKYEELELISKAGNTKMTSGLIMMLNFLKLNLFSLCKERFALVKRIIS
ncbi:hypothetical protein AB1303_00390 [Saccharolobus solfataricus]|jgi:hypothetical protein|nr:hypothetical protein [Saccharolobus solfataricus]